MCEPERIVIAGCGGAGKSTLARRLGMLLDLPVMHLDALLWQPGWVMTGKEEERALIAEWVARERWIIDGNYAGTLPMRLERASTILYLDFPGWLCLLRVLRRVARYYGRTRPDMAPGCPEKIDAEFVRWIIRFRRDVRPRVMGIIEEFADGRDVHIFTRPADVSRFLQQLEQENHDRTHCDSR